MKQDPSGRGKIASLPSELTRISLLYALLKSMDSLIDAKERSFLSLLSLVKNLFVRENFRFVRLSGTFFKWIYTLCSCFFVSEKICMNSCTPGYDYFVVYNLSNVVFEQQFLKFKSFSKQSSCMRFDFSSVTIKSILPLAFEYLRSNFKIVLLLSFLNWVSNSCESGKFAGESR